MSKRIDREYLKPQLEIFENAVIEWSVIYFVFLTPFVVEQLEGDYSFESIFIGFAAFYIFFGLMFLIPRTIFSSYFAMRKVVMRNDSEEFSVWRDS